MSTKKNKPQPSRLSQCPPPRNFHPAGRVRNVKWELADPAFIRRRKASGARAAGIRYEKKVQERLEQAYPKTYIRSPWLTFFRDGAHQLQWCQPDGILVDIVQGIIVVLEIKLRHTSDSWWQLRQLYIPVLGELFGSAWRFKPIEVCRWFDPDERFPEEFQMLENLTYRNPSDFGVHIWRL